MDFWNRFENLILGLGHLGYDAWWHMQIKRKQASCMIEEWCKGRGMNVRPDSKPLQHLFVCVRLSAFLSITLNDRHWAVGTDCLCSTYHTRATKKLLVMSQHGLSSSHQSFASCVGDAYSQPTYIFVKTQMMLNTISTVSASWCVCVYIRPYITHSSCTHTWPANELSSATWSNM